MSTTNPPEYQQSPPQPPPLPAPPKRHRVRRTLLIIGGAFLALILVIVIINLATAKPKPAAAPSTSAPATPAQPATASGYLTAHGFTVVQSFSHAKWLSMLTPGTAYAQYVAAGSDVVADGLKGSQVEFAIKVSDPAAAASVAPSSLTLDGTYLVGSMTMPASSPSASSQAPTTTTPTTAAPAATSAPAAPAMTASQQQAVDAAQGYLALGSGFSYQGLLQQLTSSAGNGFSTADATFAINYLSPDWDAQAVEAPRATCSWAGSAAPA